MKKTILIRLGLVAAAGILLVAQTKIFGPRNLQSNDIRVEYANEGATGTTLNKLAKLTGAPSTAIITATTDTSGIIGIVVGGAGTTGNAQVAVSGKASCVFDSATTAGHYVINDTSTAGDCMDGGATYPTSGQVVGVVTSTNGGAGTYTVDLSLRQPGTIKANYYEFDAAVCQVATAGTGFSTPSSNAPVATCVTGTNTNYGVLAFNDTTEQIVQVHLQLPPDWLTITKATFRWRAAAIVGNVVWKLQTACVAVGATGDPSWNAAQTVTQATQGTTLQFSEAAITNPTGTGCLVESDLFLRISRDAANGSDTMTGDAQLIWFRLDLTRQ